MEWATDSTMPFEFDVAMDVAMGLTPIPLQNQAKSSVWRASTGALRFLTSALALSQTIPELRRRSGDTPT